MRPFDEDERPFPGARRSPIDELPHRLTEIPKGPPIVLSCISRDEASSSRGAPLLRDESHENVHALKGGWYVWLAGGHPVRIPEAESVISQAREAVQSERKRGRIVIIR